MLPTVSSKPKSRAPRKLLVAALGVAAVNYVAATACGGAADKTTDASTVPTTYPPTSGNLPAPFPPDAHPPPTSGNLAPPPDAGFDASDAGDGG